MPATHCSLTQKINSRNVARTKLGIAVNSVDKIRLHDPAICSHQSRYTAQYNTAYKRHKDCLKAKFCRYRERCHDRSSDVTACFREIPKSTAEKLFEIEHILLWDRFIQVDLSSSTA